jgi:hypothetical protein
MRAPCAATSARRPRPASCRPHRIVWDEEVASAPRPKSRARRETDTRLRLSRPGIRTLFPASATLSSAAASTSASPTSQKRFREPGTSKFFSASSDWKNALQSWRRRAILPNSRRTRPQRRLEDVKASPHPAGHRSPRICVRQRRTDRPRGIVGSRKSALNYLRAVWADLSVCVPPLRVSAQQYCFTPAGAGLELGRNEAASARREQRPRTGNRSGCRFDAAREVAGTDYGPCKDHSRTRTNAVKRPRRKCDVPNCCAARLNNTSRRLESSGAPFSRPSSLAPAYQ